MKALAHAVWQVLTLPWRVADEIVFGMDEDAAERARMGDEERVFDVIERGW